MDSSKDSLRVAKTRGQALRSDRDFVLKAVSTRGSALKYATAHLRADREVTGA